MVALMASRLRCAYCGGNLISENVHRGRYDLECFQCGKPAGWASEGDYREQGATDADIADAEAQLSAFLWSRVRPTRP